MLITDAPRSAAVRTALAMVLTSPIPVPDPSLAGANFALDWRTLIKVTSGATPLKLSALGSGVAAIIPATRVPWTSQSWVPSPVDT